jgi:pyruvate/2-oxoglutarate dehydrogenase complex dihydrolipoamide acyltransferase (E2) component
MHGLLELDVTEATRLLHQSDPPLSLTAFVVASVARAAAAHPEVHVHRTWRGRLASHSRVDVATIGTRVPGVITLLYGLMGRSVRIRQRIGTVGVTAVGMFAGGGGFGITGLTLMSLQVVVGGVAPRPRAVNGEVRVRDTLDLTVTIDHDVIDGAPAARFGAELRRLIEQASVLQPGSPESAHRHRVGRGS